MAARQLDPGPDESVWARRLAGGPRFSCALGWGVGQALEGFWRNVFSGVRPGARVLELGCGSGDVSIWAAEAGRGLKIVATDVFADPDGVRRHPDVTFRGGVSAEALPFADAAFDMVVSNFAIEYADDLDAAAAEAARVLRPGGCGALVLHSADSTLTANSRALLETEALLAQAGIPDRVRRAAALRADHLSRRKLLKDVLRQRPDFPAPPLGVSGADYFDIAERLLKGDAAAPRDLETLEGALPMRLEICRRQAGVALDGPALARLAGRMSDRGLSVQISELTCTYDTLVTQKVGWIALLTRAVQGRLPEG